MNKAISIWNAFWAKRSLWCAIFFTVMLGFFDDNSVKNLLTLRHENENLREQVEKYEAEYEEALQQLQTMQNSQDAVERIARIRLQMKTDDEDIYIVE